MKDLDIRESTVSYCYETKTVEFYITKETEYNKLKKRNPNYIKAEDLKPGYRVVYPLSQCRTTDYLLRVVQKEA